MQARRSSEVHLFVLCLLLQCDKSKLWLQLTANDCSFFATFCFGQILFALLLVTYYVTGFWTLEPQTDLLPYTTAADTMNFAKQLPRLRTLTSRQFHSSASRRTVTKIYQKTESSSADPRTILVQRYCLFTGWRCAIPSFSAGIVCAHFLLCVKCVFILMVNMLNSLQIQGGARDGVGYSRTCQRNTRCATGPQQRFDRCSFFARWTSCHCLLVVYYGTMWMCKAPTQHPFVKHKQV